jgi:orotate phosphoribosyltransferase
VNERNVIALFTNNGALIVDSHIVYTGGLHGTDYINKDALYPNTNATSRLGHALAERFCKDAVEVVIAPALGGIVLAQWTAHHLSDMRRQKVSAVYAEKVEQHGSALWHICFGLRMFSKYVPQFGQPPEQYFTIRRGYDKLIVGKRVLVVEDVLNTGGSARGVVEVARKFDGNVIGLGVLWNRSDPSQFNAGGVPKFVALVNKRFNTWTEEGCALSGPCSLGTPINMEVGKGREFLARKGLN